MTTVSLANLHMRPDWHSPVSMWRHTGSDESVTDKHMKTIEMAPPSGQSFFNISIKYTYLDSFIKNIFSTSALKRYGWFSLHHFPTPQYFFNPSRNRFPRAVVMKCNCCQVSITTIIIRGILKEPEQVSFNPFPGLYPHFHTRPS